MEVVDCLVGDLLHRFVCEERLVSGDDHVGERQQPGERVVLQDVRGQVFEEELVLLLVHVQAERAEPAGLERIDDGRGVDQPTAAGVDQHGAALHLPERIRVDHVMRLRCQRCMQRDDVAFAEQLVHRHVA